MRKLLFFTILIPLLVSAQNSQRDLYESQRKQQIAYKNATYNTLAQMDLFVFCGAAMGLGNHLSQRINEFSIPKIKPFDILGFSSKHKSMHRIFAKDFNDNVDNSEIKSHYRQFNSPLINWEQRGFSVYQITVNPPEKVHLRTKTSIQWGGANGYEIEFTSDGFVHLYSSSSKKPCVKVVPSIDMAGKSVDYMSSIQDEELYFIASSRTDFDISNFPGFRR